MRRGTETVSAGFGPTGSNRAALAWSSAYWSAAAEPLLESNVGGATGRPAASTTNLDYGIREEVRVRPRLQLKRRQQAPLVQAILQLQDRLVRQQDQWRKVRERRSRLGLGGELSGMALVRFDQPVEEGADPVNRRGKVVCWRRPFEGAEFRSRHTRRTGPEDTCGCGKVNSVGSLSARSSADAGSQDGALGLPQPGGGESACALPSQKIRPSCTTNISTIMPPQRRSDQGRSSPGAAVMAGNEPGGRAAWPARLPGCPPRAPAA